MQGTTIVKISTIVVIVSAASITCDGNCSLETC